MADGSILAIPLIACNPAARDAGNLQSARLWAFIGALPAGQKEHLIRARGTDAAGNVERIGPAVRLYQAVARYWLSLALKGWRGPIVPTLTDTPAPTLTPAPTATPTPTSAATPHIRRLWLPVVMKQ